MVYLQQLLKPETVLNIKLSHIQEIKKLNIAVGLYLPKTVTGEDAYKTAASQKCIWLLRLA